MRLRRGSFEVFQSAAVLLAVIAAAGCDGGAFVGPEGETEGYVPEATTLALDSLTAFVVEQDTVYLSAEVRDQEDNVMELPLEWTSSDERIVHVESDGSTEATLVALQPGTSTITVSYEELSTSTTVEVHKRPVDLVYVSGSDQEGLAGEVLADSLVVQAVDKRGDPVSGVYLEFAVTQGGGSVAPTGVKTDVFGKARAVWTLGGPGAHQVKARASEDQARVRHMKDSVVVFTATVITVLEAVEVAPASAELEEGDTLRLKASGTTSDGSPVSDPQVSWASSDTSVATIAPDGLLRARKSGTARAIAEATSGSELVTDTADVTVNAATATVTGIEVRPDTATVDTAATQQFDAIALMSDGSEKFATVTWSATGGTIDGEGLFTAGTTAGSYEVRADHAQGFADTASVSVAAPEIPVAVVEVAPPADTVDVGQTSQFTATLYDANANVLTDRSVSWASSNTAVATVDTDGLASAVGAGDATITATAEDVSGKATLTVSHGSVADTQAPTVPTDLSATATSSSQIDLSWSASSDDVGVAGYYVYRDGSEVADVSDPGYNDVGLDAATSYSYEVAAYDAAGNVSDRSASVSATTESGTIAGAPYPASAVIGGVSFDWSSHDRQAPGSDNFPLTWADDGHQYTSWGDGGGFGGTNSNGRVSLGVARVEGPADSYTGINVNGGVNPESGNSNLSGKSYGILSLNGALYMWRSPGSGATNWDWVDLYKSTDRGYTWSTVISRFVEEVDGVGIPAFLQFGQDYAGARDDYVYSYFVNTQDASGLAVQKPGEIMLARVARSQIEDPSAYEWFAGLDGSDRPTWTPDLQGRAPVFEDPNGVGWNLSVIYNPGLDRYLLMTEHTETMVGNLGIFDAPEPWGPWTTVAYEDNWPAGGQVEYSTFFWNFSAKWWANAGQDFVLVFTGINDNDAWNAVHGSFTMP